MPRWRNPPEAGKLADLIAFGDRMFMIYLYVIKSLVRKYRYVGITNNFLKRLRQHNTGKSAATRGFRPFRGVLIETYNSYAQARKREVFMKSGQGRKFLDLL